MPDTETMRRVLHDMQNKVAAIELAQRAERPELVDSANTALRQLADKMRELCSPLAVGTDKVPKLERETPD